MLTVKAMHSYSRRVILTTDRQHDRDYSVVWIFDLMSETNFTLTLAVRGVNMPDPLVVIIEVL